MEQQGCIYILEKTKVDEMSDGNQTPQQIVYEYDPTTQVKDETGYWRLSEASSASCAAGVTPKPTAAGINPLLMLAAFPIALVGVAMIGGEGKRGGVKK